jgi:hypothetical protein
MQSFNISVKIIMPTPTPTPSPTIYSHNGINCNNDSLAIYTYNSVFNAGDTAYQDLNGTLPYSGYFIYSGVAYSYSNGIGSQYSYAYTGIDCSGSSVTIYTASAVFSTSDIGYSNQCRTTFFSGNFIYSGVVYLYNSTGTNIQTTNSYAHVGTDCSGSSVTIYTNNATFAFTDSANSDQCRTTNYNGYFIFSGGVYSYSDGSGSISSCPTPPPTPTPTPPPTPTPTPPPTPTPTPPPPTPTPPPSPAPSYTNPNTLKADIHSSYETGSGAWQTYRANVTGLFVSNSGANRADYRDHVIREFNRKISVLNQPTGLFIRPFDDGFRFTGVSIQ